MVRGHGRWDVAFPYQVLTLSRRRSTTEQKNAPAQLFAECWMDAALKARFMTDPKQVLKEHGLEVPDNMSVKVV